MQQINSRLYGTRTYPVEADYGVLGNCVVIQEIDPHPFKSQNLSDYSVWELGLSDRSPMVVVFPECGLPVLLMLQSTGKL